MSVLRRTGLIFLIGFLFGFILMTPAAWAADAFVVKNIQVEGLKGLSKATVLNYLPIKIGQTLEPNDYTPQVFLAM
jgi:outer membrane protein insertion porin family